ncbi:MAG: membrane protein insertion efficiency factor YidD [Bacteroidia bacterium]
MLFLLWGNSLISQNFHIQEIQSTFHEPHEHVKYSIAGNNTNEIQYLFSGLFLFYKFAVSSQDNNSCTFYPSCSEYGILAVKKKGALIGMLATLDRLQRCNGLSPDKYEIDIDKQALIDFP